MDVGLCYFESVTWHVPMSSVHTYANVVDCLTLMHVVLVSNTFFLLKNSVSILYLLCPVFCSHKIFKFGINWLKLRTERN